ncbi:hypothetical protein FEM03_21935 [Phragmitibacter flavus]|uniref:Uncharacterized protein n=1 Tax=Phragmitibacter flavus TaxID=2576071 RepID=A0A5R8K8B3_9BACT|nr:hypothetical protein [Phragmitibacter flavus]TLD68582.1 hypothetical protein FEM03_21935 [Phragmitibacter flavus]
MKNNCNRWVVFGLLAIGMLVGMGAGYFVGKGDRVVEGTVSLVSQREQQIREELELAKLELVNANTWIKAQNQEREKRELQWERMRNSGGISVAKLSAIKLHFNDLQREVAEGRFKGLALTPAYQELRVIFDHPDFDNLVRLNDLTME